MSRAARRTVRTAANEAKAAPKPYRSGFCGRTHPTESHERCPREYQGRPCVCDCHDPELVDLPLGQQVVKSTGGSGDEAATAPPESPASIPDDPTGLHDGLDETLYHSHAGSLSQSGAKLILKAPALYRHEQLHPAHKAVWDFGSAAHAEVLGVGSEIVVHDYDAEKVKSPKATNAWKAELAEARERGAVLLLPAEMQQVRDMADVLSSHRLAMQLLSEGQAEVSAFCEDAETGIMRRARFDWLGPTIITDYKSSVTAEPNAFLRQAINLGYHSQHAWYLDIAADLGHPASAFAFVVQEKDAPYLVTVVELPDELVAIGRARNRVALQRFRDCVESGRWPGYLSDDDFARPEAPAWALRDAAIL